MSDNFTITQGSGTTIAAQDVGGGVLEQKIQVTNFPLIQSVVLRTARTVSGVYSFALTDQAGQTTAYNFLSLFNPIASGKLLAVRKIDVQSYAAAITIAKTSLHCSRTSAASAGTLISSSAIARHDMNYVASISEVRTTNPSLTQVADLKAFPPPIVITAAGSFASPEVDLNPRDELDEIIVREGQGISFYTTGVGDVDQNYNIRVVWMEYI